MLSDGSGVPLVHDTENLVFMVLLIRRNETPSTIFWEDDKWYSITPRTKNICYS
jgi:hypothetical protein